LPLGFGSFPLQHGSSGFISVSFRLFNHSICTVVEKFQSHGFDIFHLRCVQGRFFTVIPGLRLVGVVTVFTTFLPFWFHHVYCRSCILWVVHLSFRLYLLWLVAFSAKLWSNWLSSLCAGLFASWLCIVFAKLHTFRIFRFSVGQISHRFHLVCPGLFALGKWFFGPQHGSIGICHFHFGLHSTRLFHLYSRVSSSGQQSVCDWLQSFRIDLVSIRLPAAWLFDVASAFYSTELVLLDVW